MMIDGVISQPLKQFIDGRGRVMQMIRADNPIFEHFGEIYFSEILPEVIKAWKLHNKTTQLFTVPVGSVKLVLFDNRPDSQTKGQLQEFIIDRQNYQLIKVPPSIWYGFKCLSDHPALVANCIDLPHNPEEAENISIDNDFIPYQWPE